MAAHVIRLILVLSLASLWFFGTATESHACSCGDPGSPSEELEWSAAVFAGKVVSIRDPDGPDVSDSENHLTIGFEVDTVWKGPAYEVMYVTTSPHESACGFAFVEGEEYIVYSDDRSSTHLCSRTRPLSAAEEDLEALGGGGEPQSGTSAPTPQPQSSGGAPQSGTSAPTPQPQSSGGGCVLSSPLGGGTADASWLGMMIAMGVWFGARRR